MYAIANLTLPNPEPFSVGNGRQSKLFRHRFEILVDVVSWEGDMAAANIDEEKNLLFDKPRKGKSVDQMKKHTVDTNLDNRPIERAIHILSQGDDVQKLSIIQSLPQLISLDPAATYGRIIPKIQQDLPQSSSEVQMTTSRAFQTLLESQMNLPILTSMIQGLDAKDPNISVSWGDTLLAVVPNVTEEVIKSHLLPVTKSKSASNSPVASKVFAAKLLGKISTYPKLTTIDVKKDILPLALSLCQDVSPEVRASICGSIASIAQGIGTDFSKTNLLPSLVELASDGNCGVRGVAIVAISEILPKLDSETKKQTMVPLLKQLCEKAKQKDDTTSLVLAGQFGTILMGLEKCLKTPDIQYFLTCYKGLSERGKGATYDAKVDAQKEVVCREKCASNLLSVIKFVLANAPEEFQFVYTIVKELASDPCYLVRRSMAGNIAGIAKTLGEQNKIMKNEVVKLLRDDAIEVMELLVPNISGTFLSFCQHGTLSPTASNQASTDIGRALFKCNTELARGYNWRLTVTFLEQLECLPLCFPADFIHNTFSPVILDKVLNGQARPIRIQAVRTLMVFLRYNFKPNQVKWLKDSIIKKIAESEKCYTRSLYIYACNAALDIFSEKYFKENFLSNLLVLSTDKIPNMRYLFMMLSTRLKNMVTLQSDAKARQQITDAILKLETCEKNRVVLEMVRLRKKDPPPKNNAERLKIEEKRVQEEDAQTIPKPGASVQEGSSRPAAAAKPAGAPTSAAPPPPKLMPTNSSTDMIFLEQHFYIDAGVNLPKHSPRSAAKKKFVSLSDLENYNSTNITDDAKVSLRRLSKSRLVPPKSYGGQGDEEARTKRHSSVISANYFERDRKSLNRRSLTLPSSRIPVKNGDGDCKRRSNCTDNVKIKSVSGLPVYTRKSLAQKPNVPAKS